MERHMIKVIIGFFFVLFVAMSVIVFYGILKIEPSPVENQSNIGSDESSDSAGGGGGGSRGGSGELGTISPLSGNGSSGSAGGSSGGGSAGGGGGGGGESTNPPEVKLPSDLYTAPCGIYFTAYGICNGSCEEGVCTQEGRSCYCKRV